MKRQIFTILMVLVLAIMGSALMAQTNATGTAAQGDQRVDQSGQPETGPGPDVDVDTGKNANGAVDVDVTRHTDADTAANENEKTGTAAATTDTGMANDQNNLPATGSELPLVGLVGLLSLAGACTFRALR